MEVFSPFAFKFGILFFFCICLTNLVFSWLCILFNVRILTFALLSDAWGKYIFKKTINGTEFILGWMPLGGYIKPLGMYIEEKEINSILVDDKPFALAYKPKIQQQIFKASPYLVLTTLLVLFIYLINPIAGFYANLMNILTFTITSVKSMFGYFPKADFEKYAAEFSSHYQLLPFSLLVFYITFIVFTLLSSTMQVFADDKKSKLKKWIGGLFFLFIFYMMFWKIPSFAFSFFTFGNVLRYILSAIIGIYFASIFTYWLIIPLIKLN